MRWFRAAGGLSLGLVAARHCAPVAQLDRAPGFEPVGRGFKSLRARHPSSNPSRFRPAVRGTRPRVREGRSRKVAADCAIGRPICPNDLWIAALAQARDVPLITHNLAEFRRVPGLSVDTWMTA